MICFQQLWLANLFQHGSMRPKWYLKLSNWKHIGTLLTETNIFSVGFEVNFECYRHTIWFWPFSMQLFPQTEFETCFWIWFECLPSEGWQKFSFFVVQFNTWPTCSNRNFSWSVWWFILCLNASGCRQIWKWWLLLNSHVVFLKVHKPLAFSCKSFYCDVFILYQFG